MITMLGSIIGKAIAKGAIDAIKDYQERLQIERMQAEILSGWGSKILQSVKDGCIRAGVSPAGYEIVVKEVKDTIEKEFDNRNI